MKIKAYAKLNLVLDVKNKQPDGYHEIEFINTQLELHDLIELEETSAGITIECTDKSIPTDNSNLCYKAAEIMISKLKQPKGIKIKIIKHIPMSAGLGGGSADAAAVFKALNQLWKLNLTQQQLIDLAKTISTDACYCIVGGTCLVKGRGEIIKQLDNIPKLNMAIITPNLELNNNKNKKTAWMYSQLNLTDNPYHPNIQQMLDSIKQQDKNMIICSMGNIFETAEPDEYEPVKKLMQEISPKCVKTMLAGSGPSIIAVTNTDLESQLIAEHYNGCFTKTRHPKKVIIAEGAGFCYGVKRALDLTEAVNDNEVHTLGPLIHNPQVIEKLESKGVHAVKSADDVDIGTLVIRTHGVPKKIVEKAERRGLSVLDATCPFVKSVQTIALDLEKKGYTPVILGEKDHAEVIGIAGNLKHPIIVKDLEEVAKLGRYNKLGIVSQTTQPEEKFNQVVDELKQHCDKLAVYNTICSATRSKQDNAARLAKQVDLMIVVGGHNSGNTKRLKELCSGIVKTEHIETAGELNQEMFGNTATIGIAAGASTPTTTIQSIITRIENEF